MFPSLYSLPEEVLRSILYYCDPITTAALARTGRRFERVTNEPLIWRFYCQTLFKYWDNRHDMSEKLVRPAPAVNWKALYVSRHLTNRAAGRLFDSILASQTGRLRKVRMIIDLGSDIRDTLLQHSSVGSEFDDHLARRYYAQAILAHLNRTIAVTEWAKLRIGEAISLEKALGAFDIFVSERSHETLDDISIKLDEVVTQLVTEIPNIGQHTPRERALTVASCLRQNNLTGIEPGREYHLLEHNFLGIALDDTGHNSLPLVSAAIYCYIAQRVGVDARLCGFPLHVHVIILPPLGFDLDGNAVETSKQCDPMYLDPFRSDRETHVSDLRNQLTWLGASHVDQSNFLGESRTSQIVVRCGKNILASIQHMHQFPAVHAAMLDVDKAKYAALWSSMLLSDPIRPVEVRYYLPWLMDLLATDFPYDIYLAEQYVVPLLRGLPEHEHILENLLIMQAVDEMPKQTRRRVTGNNNVKYHIGQVFRHRRYDYKGIITGWDPECGADEHWMLRMGIDRLQAGRHQSFYHALVEDKTLRYVAEENIEVIASHSNGPPQSLVAIAGRHFKRWDAPSQSFVSNIRDEYPED